MPTDIEPKTTETTRVQREPLRWLFVAHYPNGDTITQDADDTCHTRTDGTGSAFTDVLAQKDKPIAFELLHVDGKQTALVDLVNGSFKIGDTPFHTHEQNFDPTQHELELIYFRESRVDNEVKATMQEDGSIKRELISATHYANRYFIGWQATLDKPVKYGGKVYKGNIKAMIAVG